MDFINLGREDCARGTELQTSKKAHPYIRKWNDFCTKTGIEDEFLSSKNNSEKIEIVCVFAAAIQRNHFGKKRKRNFAWKLC